MSRVVGSTFFLLSAPLLMRIIIIIITLIYYFRKQTPVSSPHSFIPGINANFLSFFLENSLQTVIMPKFNRNTYYGDLAILELKHASDLKPLALPTMYTKPASVSRVTAVGWGNTELINEPEGLRYTNLTTMNASTCDSQHKEIYKKFSRPLGTMCFGMAGHKSTCGGDSGGPIFIPSSPARAEPVLVGVTSYNFYKYKCGNQTSRGLPMATSVPYWSEWIKNTMSFYNLLGTTMPLRYNSAAGDSVCFSGLSLASKKAVYAGECTEFCRSHAACKAWTYRSDLRTCTLKSTLAPVTKYLDACVSGYMDD